MQQHAQPGDAAGPRVADRDDVAGQSARLLAYLRRNGRIARAELERACDVPSVTKRISELIAAGWPINRHRGYVLTERGNSRRTTFYQLTGPHPQADLFTDA